MLYGTFLLIAALPAAFGVTLQARQSSSNTAVVDLTSKRGSPQHLASGFIYGVPDSGFGQSATQIPNSFYTDVRFNYARAGGAQMSHGGWIYGISAYKARFASTKSNYLTARKYGARFQILPHDLWGTDHANSSTVWPGDNSNWTDYDNFLNQLISDLKPDGGFWARSASQYYDLYVRSYKRFRSDSALNGVLIVGPSTAGQPSTSNTFWKNWLQAAINNKAIPDQYTWQDEPGDVANDIDGLNALLQQYGAPSKPVNINEYATFDQQVSAGAAWWISRPKRYNMIGLRGNWLSTCQLHDYMASLLGKSDTSSCTSSGYYGNGEFQVYKYYNRNMTGTRAGTTTSGDGVIDVYSTIGLDKVRTLTGVNLRTGTWYVTSKSLSSVGLPTSGSLNIQTWGFDDKGYFGQVNGPSNRGIVSHTYSGDSVTFPIYQTTQDEYTAWGFEFNIAKGVKS